MKIVIKDVSLEVDVQYPKILHNLHNDLPFLPERMKIEKVEKVVANLHDKKRMCYTQKEFKTSTKAWIIVLKKVHRVIKSDLKAWLQPYIDMNTKLKKTAKNDFEKDFFTLMNNTT